MVKLAILADLVVKMRIALWVCCMLAVFGCASEKAHKAHQKSAQRGLPPLLSTLDDRRFSHDTQPDVGLQGDACALLAAYPHWRKALAEVQQYWQIPPWFVLGVMHQESRFNPKALSRSLAYGLPQAKDDTWAWYELKRGRRGASRERFDDAIDFIAWYAHQNQRRNHISLSDLRNNYLAYHEGLGGFEKKSFLAKPWLLEVADKVVDRAMLYQAQLLECPF